jgi:hypothetical protein
LISCDNLGKELQVRIQAVLQRGPQHAERHPARNRVPLLRERIDVLQGVQRDREGETGEVMPLGIIFILFFLSFIIFRLMVEDLNVL